MSFGQSISQPVFHKMLFGILQLTFLTNDAWKMLASIDLSKFLNRRVFQSL